MCASFTVGFDEIRMPDVPRVGGKNASLGELYHIHLQTGIGALDGFAITTDAYWHFLQKNDLRGKLEALFAKLSFEDITALKVAGETARQLILATPVPDDLTEAILKSAASLRRRTGATAFAVRSSASAEDLPEASFAGAAESFLNVAGDDALLQAVHKCLASLFTDRAIDYRARQGYSQLKVALSIGVMPMVRSDLASSGVIFTLDTESGFRDAITVSGSYGLGEFVVKGVVTPDEWTIFKTTLNSGASPIIGRRLGSKEQQLVYGDAQQPLETITTPSDQRKLFCLTDAEVLTLARWSCAVEDHYSELAGKHQPMDIEWAKDGVSQKLYIVQARPETVHSSRTRSRGARKYSISAKGIAPLTVGQAVGERIGSGKVRVVHGPDELTSVQSGEILVASRTDPDWEPVMRRVAGIITDQGGRTAHAAIVSREFGIPCIVGTGAATASLHTGQEVTVCCAEGSEGRVYPGLLPFVTEEYEMEDLPELRTKLMLIVADPSKAFDLSLMPNDGVGLARIEFIIANHIGIHPMALANFEQLAGKEIVDAIRARIGAENPREFFIRSLSEGIGRIAAAFYPRSVIVRLSDFKTNEYARLLGGALFELEEENPMLGFRGAYRYYHSRYEQGFALECAALSRVRSQFGLKNVRVMVPFCRTLEEADRVLQTMADHGLKRGADGLEVYAMCEIPSNAILAAEFLKRFDGYSIGSNDLTQLTLGLDRDSAVVAPLFREDDAAVRWLIARAIQAAKQAGKPIGICGQAPSDHPEFARWLTEQGIDSISVNPDALKKTSAIIAEAEKRQQASKPDAA